MAVFNQNQNPFETSFETMTNKAGGAVKQVKKATDDAAAAIMTDIKGQVMGVDAAKSEEKVVDPAKQKEIQDQQKQVLAQTRDNLEKLNQEISEVRKKKEKAYQDKLKAEAQKKQEKKKEEEKKKDDPIWKQMLKKGSHEAMKNVAG